MFLHVIPLVIRYLERLLNLQRGDLSRGGLLFLYLFVIITIYVIGKVARNALFLGQFAAVELPYFILIIAVLTGFVVAGYVRLGQRIRLRNLLVASQLFFASNAVVFWALGHYYQLPWLYPVIYVWVGIFGVLAPAQVWTLANYVLTTREAKRLFALVSAGAILGWIFGGFFSKQIQQLMGKTHGTEVLLLFMAFFLVISSLLVVFIWRQRESFLVSDKGRPGESDAALPAEAKSVWHSLKLIGSSRYLQAISVVICLSSVATTVAGWQLDAVAQRALVTEAKLATFYADFYFYAAIAALLTNLILTSRLLRHLGIGPALLVVPLALVFGEIGLLLLGSLLAVILLKGSDQVLRYSVDKSTVELLYLPVAPNEKMQVKSFIDTAIWRFGDGLAAMAILAFATTLGWSAVRISWINLFFLACWASAALVARQQYVAHLRESIRQQRLDANRTSAPVLDRATTDILVDNLGSADPKEIIYALDLFRMGHQWVVHPQVRDLLEHPEAEVRVRALSILLEAGDRGVLPQVEGLLTDPDPGVRAEALRFLTHHEHIDPLARIHELKDFPDSSIRSGIVAFLAHTGDPNHLSAARLMLEMMVKEAGPTGRATRLEAAKLLATLPQEFDEQICRLLADEDPEVACAAIATMGRLGKRRFVMDLIDLLANPEFTDDVVEALGEMGERIIGTMRDHLIDDRVPIQIRLEIPAIFVRIATPEAARMLLAGLRERDPILRFKVIAALNKIREARPDISLDEQMIEAVLVDEIVEHYRSYKVLGKVALDLNGEEASVEAIRHKLEQEIERIFRLLSLLYPQHDLKSAYLGIQSKNSVVHDNALEFLDNVLKRHLRHIFVPLIDSEVGIAERMALAERFVGRKKQSREEVVAELLGSEDPRLKAFGAYAVGMHRIASLESELDKCLKHEDSFVRQTAHQAKLRLAGNVGSAD
jgi:AAA family ATP:ADP antiporter